MDAVIFIGIPATGKSTFYQERFAATHVRINLDMLRTRRREDFLLDACIRAGISFVVDNTNVLARERAKYIALARTAGYTIRGYYFQSRLQESLQRNQQRSGKSVVPEKGMLAKYRLIERPQYAEGFDQLYYVSIDPQAGFRVEEWHEIPSDFVL